MVWGNKEKTPRERIRKTKKRRELGLIRITRMEQITKSIFPNL